MNTKNLISTPTADMSREDWLNFRKPLWHVKKIINADQYYDEVQLYSPGVANYEWFEQLFKTEWWEKYNFPCIGGSEVSTVMGLNQYKSIIELFYEKVGIKETPDIDNAAMFWGRELEEQIADKWQYWTGNVEEMIENYRVKNVVRRCFRVNAYLQNKEFPWIFVSLDRRIVKSKEGQASISAGEGVLECKTISGFAADQWESGFPPGYVMQIQTQLGVTELGFGESAILKDGRHFEVLPFDRNDNIIDAIKYKCQAFYAAVKKGIEHYILSTVAPNEGERNRHLAAVDALAPEPDSSVSYEAYLKATYTDKGYEVLGNDEELLDAVQYQKLKGYIETLQEKQQLHKNKLLKALGDASVLNFGEQGKVTYRANKKGTRSFRCDVKVVDEAPKQEQAY